MKTKKPAQLDREIDAALSKQSGRVVFPLTDAKLAIDIAAVRDQISQLCERLRYDSRKKPQAVLAQLDDVQSDLGDALRTVLTGGKS